MLMCLYVLSCYVISITTVYTHVTKRIYYVCYVCSLLDCGFDLPTPGSVVNVSTQCHQVSSYVIMCRQGITSLIACIALLQAYMVVSGVSTFPSRLCRATAKPSVPIGIRI
jgi:hypothetical protein